MKTNPYVKEPLTAQDHIPDATKMVKRPQNCGTGFCSCIECVVKPGHIAPVRKIVPDHFADAGNKVLDHIADADKMVAETVKQKPVAWWEFNEDIGAWFLSYTFNPKAKTRPLIFGDIAPLDRQWVDLTDGEIEEAFKSASKIMKPWEPVKAVIAAFKEKNK